jgi:hypothetical protein
VAITTACQSKYASSNHIGFLNADASLAGKLCGVPIELEVGCEALPFGQFVVGGEALELEGEEEGELDDVDAPANEPPPPAEATPDAFFFVPEC